MKRVLLLGSYGQTNIGDDVLLFNYLSLLGTEYDEIYINANDANNIPLVIQKTFPQIIVLETYDTGLRDWLQILKKVDCVVYGGGTIYKELYGSTGRLRHSVTLRMALFNLLARLFGAKIYHLHIGIGKINTWLGRLIARVGLKTATYTIFRDRQSYNFARQTLGIAKKRIGLSTDGLFLNRRWEKPWSKAELGINKKQYKTVVGINMLSDIPDFINRDRYIKTMRDLVNQLLAAELFVVLIPFQYRFNVNNDHAFMQQNIVPFIKRQHGWRLLPQVEIDEVSSVLAQCDVLIGMRFHSLLLATAVGTPFVAITYDTKCQRYVEEIAYPHHIKLEDATANRLQTQLAFVLHNKAALSKTVKSTADNYYKEVKQCLQYTPF